MFINLVKMEGLIFGRWKTSPWVSWKCDDFAAPSRIPRKACRFTGCFELQVSLFLRTEMGGFVKRLGEIMFSGFLKSGFPRRFPGDFRKFLAARTKYVPIPTVPNAYVIRSMEKMRVDEHGKTGDLRADLFSIVVTKRRVRNLCCEIKKAISENVEMWRTA